MTSRQVRIGKIVGCHGVRGEVKVRPASEEAAWADSLRCMVLRKPGNKTDQQLTIASMRRHGPQVLVTFEGYGNRNLVEPLIGSEVYADIDDLPEPEEGEYWADDLIGLNVVDVETGRVRGVVKDLLSSGGSDFLEIKIEETRETVVIPFIDRFFPEVNLEARTVSIDLLSEFLSISNEPVTQDRLVQ